MQTGRRRARGFAYVLLLGAVAVIGIALASAASIGAVEQRRGEEMQLLAIGAEYQHALQSFAGLPPGSQGQIVHGPNSLEELLKDPRTPGLRRHLRRIYEDPLTGKHTWGIVRNESGKIVGIYSLAKGRPSKQKGFDASMASFEDAESYEQWLFSASGQTVLARPNH